MEHAVYCNNHPDRNAVRLCDGCGVPFCQDCLREDDFYLCSYYCQNCHPALFKKYPASEYEIPIDEKGLKKVQNRIESQIREKKEKFNIGVFLKLLFVYFVVLESVSVYYDYLSMSNNPYNGRCDIHGDSARYTVTETKEIGSVKIGEKEIHEYCEIHAIGWAFIHPIYSFIYPLLTNRYITDVALISLFAHAVLLGLVAWVSIPHWYRDELKLRYPFLISLALFRKNTIIIYLIIILIVILIFALLIHIQNLNRSAIPPTRTH